MSDPIVYLSGRIAGIPRLAATGWRDRFTAKYPHVLDPMKRPYNEDGTLEYVNGIVEGDKADILASDVLLVYYEKPSVGTAMEILFAWDHGKTVIVVDAAGGLPLSPWIRYHANHIVKNFSEALVLIKNPEMAKAIKVLEPKQHPEGTTLKFTCREYIGVEVYDNDGNPWTSPELKLGETILVPGLFGGFHRLVVSKRDTPTSGFAGEGDFGAILEFGGDDRNRWICTALANLKGVEKIKFT